MIDDFEITLGDHETVVNWNASTQVDAVVAVIIESAFACIKAKTMSH